MPTLFRKLHVPKLNEKTITIFVGPSFSGKTFLKEKFLKNSTDRSFSVLTRSFEHFSEPTKVEMKENFREMGGIDIVFFKFLTTC